MSDQAEHARIFGEVSRQLLVAAQEFAAGVASHLTALDVGRIYLGVAVTLIGSVVGRDGAAAMLRQLADDLERERPKAN